MTTELTEDEWREATTYDLLDWHCVFDTEDERDASWDRFLARVRRDAAKAAWDEAIEEALDGWTIPANGDIEAVRFILLSTNPYMPEEPSP